MPKSLPVDDNSVDVIISNCVINLCEDKGLVFNEAFRTLGPGGRLEISDMVTSRALSVAERLNVMEWAECVSGALPEKEYLDLIAQAGFEDIKVRRSETAGEMNGVRVYSAIVSARKPGESRSTPVNIRKSIRWMWLRAWLLRLIPDFDPVFDS